jgi:hypothetical protein
MFSGYQPRQLVERSVHQRFEEVMMSTETVLDTVVYPSFNHLMWRPVREYFTEDF